jgi:hypothetical protein
MSISERNKMKQTYYLELNKQEVELLKSNCKIAYQIYKENWSFKMMRKTKGIERKLEILEKNV